MPDRSPCRPSARWPTWPSSAAPAAATGRPSGHPRRAGRDRPCRWPRRRPRARPIPRRPPRTHPSPLPPQPPLPRSRSRSAEANGEHVDREAVVVAEFADEGAEDGAGAQIHVGEPWEGYGSLTAKEVNDRLAAASPESLAVARLYETAHRNRVTVLRAIDRRLAAAGSD